jgi:hypothetical protein
MHRIITTAIVATATLVVTASPAFADDEYTTDTVAPSWTAGSAESCADPEVSPMLAAFKDDDLYSHAPGGTFDDGPAGWQLAGGATVAPATSGIFGSSGGALALPVGASATSPTFCVDERYPHFRFGFAQDSEQEDADVRVEVLYPGLADKNVRRAKDVKAKHGRGWELSDRVKLNPTHGLKRGGWRLVAVRFQVKDGKPGASVRIDDVLVDPRAKF